MNFGHDLGLPDLYNIGYTNEDVVDTRDFYGSFLEKDEENFKYRNEFILDIETKPDNKMYISYEDLSGVDRGLMQGGLGKLISDSPTYKIVHGYQRNLVKQQLKSF